MVTCEAGVHAAKLLLAAVDYHSGRELPPLVAAAASRPLPAPWATDGDRAAVRVHLRHLTGLPLERSRSPSLVTLGLAHCS